MRRKRKRVAVEPCLELYASSPCPSSPRTLEKTLGPQSGAVIDLPHVAVLTPLQETSDDVHTSELSVVTEETSCEDQLDEVLTVDAFLRRSAEKPQKKYGNRKRRIANLVPVYEGLVPIPSIPFHTCV